MDSTNPQQVKIGSVATKIEFERMVAMRDAVEYMEDDNPGDAVIMLLGKLTLYDDTTMVFSWKGKDAIVFHPLSFDEDENIIFTFDKLYLEDNNQRDPL